MKMFNESQARTLRDSLNAQAQRLGLAPRATSDVLGDVDQLTADVAAHGQPRRTAGHATEESKSTGTTSELIAQYGSLKTDSERASFIAEHAGALTLAFCVGEAGAAGLDALSEAEAEDPERLFAAYGELKTDAEKNAFLHVHGDALESAIVNGK